MKWFVKCIRNSLNFRGRASRTEFWYFMLFMFLILCVTFAVVSITQWIYIPVVLVLALLLPYSAVALRRLHDIGRSGWWVGAGLLLFFVSRWLGRYTLMTGEDAVSGTSYRVSLSLSGVVAVYSIFLLVWCLRRSDEGNNDYGPEPNSCD